jgi:hypothetical protein
MFAPRHVTTVSWLGGVGEELWWRGALANSIDISKNPVSPLFKEFIPLCENE